MKSAEKTLLYLAFISAVFAGPAFAQNQVTIVDPTGDPEQTYYSGNDMSVTATVQVYTTVAYIRIKIVNRNSPNTVYSSTTHTYSSSPFATTISVPSVPGGGDSVPCRLDVEAVGTNGSVVGSDSVPITVFGGTSLYGAPARSRPQMVKSSPLRFPRRRLEL
jgi:hypothetical protein